MIGTERFHELIEALLEYGHDLAVDEHVCLIQLIDEREEGTKSHLFHHEFTPESARFVQMHEQLSHRRVASD